MRKANKRLQCSYYRRIGAALRGSKEEKQSVVAALREDVSGYLDKNPQADLEEIQNRFGSPEYIEASLLRDLPDQQLVKKVHSRRRIVLALVAGIIAILLIWGIGVGLCVENYNLEATGYIQITID